MPDATELGALCDFFEVSADHLIFGARPTPIAEHLQALAGLWIVDLDQVEQVEAMRTEKEVADLLDKQYVPLPRAVFPFPKRAATIEDHAAQKQWAKLWSAMHRLAGNLMDTRFPISKKKDTRGADN